MGGKGKGKEREEVERRDHCGLQPPQS